MVQSNDQLPTHEGKKNGNDRSVLHANYLVGLLPPGEDVNNHRYKGDNYEEWPTHLSGLWEKETKDLPYLNSIRQARSAFPGLAHLASWMEVSTAVTRSMYLSENPTERNERAHRVRVCQVDLKKGEKPTQTHFTDNVALIDALSAQGPSPIAASDARIYVVEDLSRDVIEALGSALNVDPHFFRAHIDDYLWSGATADGAEPRNLDLITRKRPHFTLQYLRPRYYKTTASFEKATRQAASFNVLRQLDSDRSRDSMKNDHGAAAALMRAKASLWIRPRATLQEGVLAILLVDPTITEGYQLWRAYDSFANWENNRTQTGLPEPPRTSLFDDVIYWMTRLDEVDIESIREDPKGCAQPALWLILSDWHHVVQYVTAQLGWIEWEIEIPALRKETSGIDATMRKLHPWRRNVSLYRAMVAQSIDRIFTKEMQRKYEQDLPDPDRGLPALFRDFQIVLRDIDTIQARIERIVSVAAALLSIEEGRRAMNQNNNVARLTYLATIFIPLSFVSGFLSMAPDISRLRQTFWVFFAIAIPLTGAALFVADFLHIRNKIEAAYEKRRKKRV